MIVLRRDAACLLGHFGGRRAAPGLGYVTTAARRRSRVSARARRTARFHRPLRRFDASLGEPACLAGSARGDRSLYCAERPFPTRYDRSPRTTCSKTLPHCRLRRHHARLRLLLAQRRRPNRTARSKRFGGQARGPSRTSTAAAIVSIGDDLRRRNHSATLRPERRRQRIHRRPGRTLRLRPGGAPHAVCRRQLFGHGGQARHTRADALRQELARLPSALSRSRAHRRGREILARESRDPRACLRAIRRASRSRRRHHRRRDAVRPLHGQLPRARRAHYAGVRLSEYAESRRARDDVPQESRGLPRLDARRSSRPDDRAWLIHRGHRHPAISAEQYRQVRRRLRRQQAHRPTQQPSRRDRQRRKLSEGKRLGERPAGRVANRSGCRQPGHRTGRGGRSTRAALAARPTAARRHGARSTGYRLGFGGQYARHRHRFADTRAPDRIQAGAAEFLRAHALQPQLLLRLGRVRARRAREGAHAGRNG